MSRLEGRIEITEIDLKQKDNELCEYQYETKKIRERISLEDKRFKITTLENKKKLENLQQEQDQMMQEKEDLLLKVDKRKD